MIAWLLTQGNSKFVIDQFVSNGHYPSLVIVDEYN